MATLAKIFRKVLIPALAALSLSACKKEKVPEAAELRIFSWSDYIQEGVVKAFEAEHKCKVIIDYFSSNEELLAKVRATVQAGGRGYDLIVPSDYMVGNMVKLGLLQAVDKAQLKFLPDFDPAFLKPEYDPSLTYAVPFAWGSTGVAVNTKLAAGLIDLSKGISWKDFFENPKLQGKVTLLDDSKESLHAALMVQGKTWTQASDADIQNAFAYLKAHKKQIKLFTAETRSTIEAGDCVVCQAFSGDVLQVRAEKPEIQYMIPKEGATLWTDNLAIPKNAGNVALAHAFMNKMLSAEGANSFTATTFYPTANKKARALEDKALTANTAIYPDPKTFAKLGYITEKVALLPQIDRLWTELKSQ